MKPKRKEAAVRPTAPKNKTKHKSLYPSAADKSRKRRKACPSKWFSRLLLEAAERLWSKGNTRKALFFLRLVELAEGVNLGGYMK